MTICFHFGGGILLTVVLRVLGSSLCIIYLCISFLALLPILEILGSFHVMFIVCVLPTGLAIRIWHISCCIWWACYYSFTAVANRCQSTGYVSTLSPSVLVPCDLHCWHCILGVLSTALLIFIGSVPGCFLTAFVLRLPRLHIYVGLISFVYVPQFCRVSFTTGCM